MDRRHFIGMIGSAAAYPLAARAQQGKLPTIGYFGTTTPSTWAPWTAAFVQRLRELGWIEGQTVAIEYRWAEARSERFADIAAELVRLKVDVIVTGGAAVPAVKQATSVIPVVFAIARDPLGEGLVASLARPSGNATGLSLQIADLAGKRLELLREVVPSVRKLAVMVVAGDPAASLERGEVEAAARTLGLEAIALEIRRADEIGPAIEAGKARVDALYVCSGQFINTHRNSVFTQALAVRLPAISGLKVYAEAGGLISYGPNYADLFRRAGEYVDKILRGAKPADIPVEQPTKFETVFNLKTAKVLGIEIPSRLLFTADEVIE